MLPSVVTAGVLLLQVVVAEEEVSMVALVAVGVGKQDGHAAAATSWTGKTHRADVPPSLYLRDFACCSERQTHNDSLLKRCVVMCGDVCSQGCCRAGAARASGVQASGWRAVVAAGRGCRSGSGATIW